VTQMDQATQQNAALVEEMAAAASSLRSQAQELVSTVAQFKLGDSAGVFASREVATPVVTKLPPTVQAAKPTVPQERVLARTSQNDWETF